MKSLKQQLRELAEKHNLELDKLMEIRKQILDIGDEGICPICLFSTIISYNHIYKYGVPQCPDCDTELQLEN